MRFCIIPHRPTTPVGLRSCATVYIADLVVNGFFWNRGDQQERTIVVNGAQPIQNLNMSAMDVYSGGACIFVEKRGDKVGLHAAYFFTVHQNERITTGEKQTLVGKSL